MKKGKAMRRKDETGLSNASYGGRFRRKCPVCKDRPPNNVTKGGAVWKWVAIHMAQEHLGIEGWGKNGWIK